MNGKFDGVEIKRQAGRIREQIHGGTTSPGFKNTGTGVNNCLDYIAREVEAEDSNLAATIMETSEIYTNMRICIEQKFEELATVMENWAARTIENEQKRTQTVEGLNSEINS